MPPIMRFTMFAGSFALIASLSVRAQAQTQASCQFTSFSRIFTIPGGTRFLVPRGINDYNTVVGDAQDNTDFSVRAFTRWSGGGITYYRHSSNGAAGNTTFTQRSNGGISVGVADSSTDTYLASATGGTPFTFKGSTFTPFDDVNCGNNIQPIHRLGHEPLGHDCRCIQGFIRQDAWFQAVQRRKGNRARLSRSR